MTDNLEVARILGDPVGFFTGQRERLAALDIDVAGMAVSHLAFRTETIEEYIDVRDALEEHCVANVENVWNGRRISKLLLQTPLELSVGTSVTLIELVPPEHQSVYRMGLEHVGFVVGAHLDRFAEHYWPVLTGRQDQGPFCKPWYITFEDHTNVKFYVHSLQEVCVLEGRRFDGFHHATETVP